MPDYRFTIEDVLDFLTAPDGDWDNELNAWVNVKVDGHTAVMTFNPTLGDDEDQDPDADLRERFRVTVERIDPATAEDRIVAIRARLDTASPWPWETTANGLVLGQPRPEHAGERHVADTVLNADAELIASAPADLAWALDEIDRLREQLVAARPSGGIVKGAQELIGDSRRAIQPPEGGIVVNVDLPGNSTGEAFAAGRASAIGDLRRRGGMNR